MSQRVRLSAAAAVAVYGLIVIVANFRNGLLPRAYTREWVLFGGSTDFPGDFGRNVFGSSIGFGILMLVLAAAVAVIAGRPAARLIGSLAVAFGVLLVALYSSSGNLLAAKPAGAAVIAVVGLFLLASPLAQEAHR
ncbi:MAG: hypothetical protein H0U22_18095 [Geodermatophilaceae bacterium]|nr:hypothetical protein [Geodermatophilaceae bacterium]